MPRRRVIYRSLNVEISLARRSILRDGQALCPRTKVFELLLQLVECRDRLVTKEELMERLWPDATVGENSLAQCVNDLRKTLGDDARSPRFIRTVPKVGYQFIAPVEEFRPGSPRIHWKWLPAPILMVLLLVLVLNPAWRKTEQPRGEVAWWRFDEGVGARTRDSSGHGNDGVLRNGPVWADGRLGKALQFDGIRSHVTGTNPGRSFPRGGAARTVSAWIRAASTNGDFTSIFHYGTSGSPYSRFFQLTLCDDGRLAAGYPIEDTLIRGTSRLDDNAWHFVAGAYEGEETNVLRVFVDGVREAEKRLRPPPKTGAGSAWRIGRFMESGTPFRGLIDDVRLYGRALSAAEVAALYRCASGQADLTIPGARRFYYLPVFLAGAAIGISPGGAIWHSNDIAGVQFAESDGLCSIESLRGADVGQDLYIAADLLAPADSSGVVTIAGPYFRSRKAAPGDGIIGGTSAGYWVQLHSTGVVKVRRLNPHQVVAFTAVPAGFDPARFHRLEITASGAELQVALDGRPQEFDQGGRRVRSVSIPSVWEGPPGAGTNRGTAGIAFSSEPRLEGRGQQARNLMIRRLR